MAVGIDPCNMLSQTLMQGMHRGASSKLLENCPNYKSSDCTTLYTCILILLQHLRLMQLPSFSCWHLVRAH